MKNKVKFIFFNTIIIAILWFIVEKGFIYSNNEILKNIALISMILIFLLEFGLECLIVTIYAYKTKSKLTINFFIFIIVINLIIIKLIVPKIYYSFIFLIILNQLLGFVFSNLLLKKKGN